MIRQTTDKGTISVSSHVYTKIAGIAATNCFGVKGMAFRSMTDGLVHLLRKEAMSKGAYKDIEAAGHHMNFVLKVSMTDMAMSFTSVFAPVAAQPE